MPRRGRPTVDLEKVLDSVICVLKTGMPWRHLKSTSFGVDYRTAHRYFRKWTVSNVFEEVYATCLRLTRISRSRRRRYRAIDSTFVKNIYGTDCVGRSPVDRGRKATKMSAVVDEDGIPVALSFFPGNVSDYNTVDETLANAFLPPEPGCALYADKGYDSRRVRSTMTRFGYVDRAERRRHKTHRSQSRKRRIVENTFAWLDKFRRLIVRYDARIQSYRAFTLLACCLLIGNRLFVR